MPELTSLRFFAAWHVVFYHNLYLAGDLHTMPWFLKQAVSMGFTAVNFFFVLSGFILTEVYYNQGHHAELEIRTFWIKRFARIYPLFFLALLLDAPRVIGYFYETSGFWAGSLKIGVAGFANIFLVQSWFPRISPSWNSPGWSLSNEAFFYMLFPFLLAWLGKGQSLRQIKLMFVFFLISMIAITPFAIIVDAKSHPELFTAARFTPLLHLPEFIFGILLAMFFQKKNSSWLVENIKKWGDLMALGFLALAVGISHTIPELYFHNGLLVPVYGLFIFSAASGLGVFSSLLKLRFFVFLGNASYAVYILHQPLKTYLLWGADQMGLPFSPALFVYYFIFVLAVSIAAYMLIEEPARRLLTRKLMPKSQALN